MSRPFELDEAQLEARLDEMVEATFADLQSQFLVLPKSSAFIEYADFQEAYEILKRETASFSVLTETSVWEALYQDALAFVVLRTIFGLSPPEWADLARSERDSDVAQNSARLFDRQVREKRDFFRLLREKRDSVTLKRLKALVSVAVDYIARGAPPAAADTVHRLEKVDTANGLSSVQHAASHHVPYAVLLYERYLGRPFASYRDSVSEMVGDVMESAIEEHLSRARITFRKTRRADGLSVLIKLPTSLFQLSLPLTLS